MNMQENTTPNGEWNTEPVQGTPTPPPAAPQPKPRVRRVGTLTMGVALIITGLALTAALVVPQFDVLLIVKLAPLVLVALGAEIFISACFVKSDKIKYDGLSIFLCLILIFGSFMASLVPTVLLYAGPQKNAAQINVEREIEDILYESRAQLVDIYDVQISVQFNELRMFTGKEGMADLQGADYVYAYITLKGDYASDADFVKAAKPVCDILLNNVPNIRKIEVNSNEFNGNEKLYTLMLRGRFHADLSEAELQELTQTRVYNTQYGDYMDENEYAQWQYQQTQPDHVT